MLRLLTRLVLLFALGWIAPGEVAARTATHVWPPDVSAQKLASWGSDPEVAVLRQAAAMQAAEMQQGTASHDYDFASGCLLAAKSETTWVTKPRGKPGADGGASTYSTEVDSAGRTVSTRHTVTRDGEVVHQHQTHVGSSGSTRSFPDEWTGTKTVNDRPVDPHYVPQGPVLPNVGPDAVPGR